MKRFAYRWQWLGGAVVVGLVVLTVPFAAADAGGPGNATPVTLDADSTSIDGILQILASRSGLNIVTSPEVRDRRITIHLRDTPADEVFNLVVRAAGVGYERVGNTILVAAPEQLAASTGSEVRVYDLQYANAQDVRDLLQVLTRDVAASADGNSLVIRASPSILEQADAVIARLDRKPLQVLFEARLIEVNTSALLELGIDWEKITKWTGVLTEGLPDPSPPGAVPAEAGFFALESHPPDWYRQMSAFQVSLDALIAQGNARLLSNSSVVTVDNVAAEIFAGETIPVVITSLQSPGGAGGVLQTVQLEKIDVGVKLQITPRVAADGMITTLVEPEVSRIVVFRGPDDDLPQTSTRRARTLVRVHDGERIYLGGLLSEEKRRNVKKVPLLGDIPLLGHLFRHYRDESIRLDLVIEITPRIVGDEKAALPVAPTTEP